MLTILLIQCTDFYKDQKTSDSKNESNSGIDFTELDKILSSKSKAVFLSFEKAEPDFGSIMLIDLISGNQIKLLDNQFYISSPILFETNKVLFASARVGSPERLRITSYHAWRQLYYIDLEKIMIENYYSESDNPTGEKISHFENLNWDSTRNQVYVLEESERVYKISTETREPILIFQPIKDTFIGNISLSPNDGYLAIECFHPKLGASIKVFSLSSDSVVTEIKNSPKSKAYLLLGWSYNNNVFCKLDSVKEFDLRLNSIANVNVNLDKNHYSIEQIFPESKETIILLIDILEKKPNARFPNTVSTEIARYNLGTNEIEWITKDGAKKESLNIKFQQ